MDCKQFYRERDRRTNAYLSSQGRKDMPVCIEVAPEAVETPAGQLLLLGLANQTARIHREICFAVEDPETQLNVRVPFAENTLGETLWETCNTIDPCGDFRIASEPDTECVSLGVGSSLAGNHDWYVGADQAIAVLSETPQPVQQGASSTLRGAALASCLGASTLLRSILDEPVREQRLSAWNFAGGENAERGPTGLPDVDVGRVMLVGAGAVGGALAYWLHAFGVRGEWAIVDPDPIELHNTNRHLLAGAEDAGWSTNGEVKQKSDLVSCYLPGTSESEWYEDATAPKDLHDVVLCLANEQDVRTKVAQRNDPVVLHATTGQSWLSQLHRHIAGRDDCIRCRTHDVREAQYECSKVNLEKESTEESQDAALPFLSAASGLMLASALHRLQLGELANMDHNNWDWDFAAVRGMSRKRTRKCQDNCNVWTSPEVRKRMNRGIQWAHLDAGLGST